MRRFLVMLCLTWSGAVAAHPLADQARAVQEQAQALAARMGSSSLTLSWGQNMALQDMTRLVTAAAAARQVLEPDEVDWEGSRDVLNELAVAGNRAHTSLSVAGFDQEGATLADQVITQVQQLDAQIRQERAANFERQLTSQRPQPTFSFGLGLGLGFGRYPAWGWGRPMFYRGWRRCR